MACLSLGFPGRRLHADSAVLTSVADTTLIEAAPDNNLGGAPIVNAGTTQTFTRNRGLFRFDIASEIPPGSRITRVDFVVAVTGKPNEPPPPSTFGLHRVLKPWGEGDKASPDPLHPGLGAQATTDEATWKARFAFTTNNWTVPGGGATNDFAPEISAETVVYDTGDSPYTFYSTPALVADAQAWLDDPTTDFGWMIICESEEINFTARRFASREDPDPDNAPQVLIEYVPPAIEQVQSTGSQLTFSFTAQAGQGYTVEFRDSISALLNWSTLTNFAAQPASTNIVVSDAITNRQRFYRLRLP